MRMLSREELDDRIRRKDPLLGRVLAGSLPRLVETSVELDDLVRKRRIHRHRVSPEEIDCLLELADRDIRMARHTMPEDWGWAFSIAYNAVLQAARAYMYSRGYRPPPSRVTRTRSRSCERNWK